MILLLGLMFNPAFAEVTSIQTNGDSFYKGDYIEFSGTVGKDSTGLVTIVIRDSNNEFVLLSQSTINYDGTFEKRIIIENKFVVDGIYKGTGFILNMTKGMTADFGVELNKIPTSEINKNSKEFTSQDSENEQIFITESEKTVEPKSADFVVPVKIHIIMFRDIILNQRTKVGLTEIIQI